MKIDKTALYHFDEFFAIARDKQPEEFKKMFLRLEGDGEVIFELSIWDRRFIIGFSEKTGNYEWMDIQI